MKTPVLISLLIVCTGGLAIAQEQHEGEEQKSRRTRLGVSAGPVVTQFFSKAYKPALSYSAGIFGVREFRRFDFQLGAQYLPIGTTFMGWDGTAEFMNHVVNFSAHMKLHSKRVDKLSFDIGASVAKGLSYAHNNPPITGLVCLIGVPGHPVPIRTQSFLLTGASWALARNNSISMRALTTFTLARSNDTAFVNLGYWILQASFSHAF
jgi:hypothetical protein